jgi:hypothetical protein
MHLLYDSMVAVLVTTLAGEGTPGTHADLITRQQLCILNVAAMRRQASHLRIVV